MTAWIQARSLKGRDGKRRGPGDGGPLAGPDPDIGVLLHARIGVGRDAGSDLASFAERGDMQTGPVAAEPPAVIGAGDRAVRDLAQRQRHAAVRAAIVQRAGRALGGAEQHDRPVGDAPRDRLVAQFGAGAGDVPGLARAAGARGRVRERLRGRRRPWRAAAGKVRRTNGRPKQASAQAGARSSHAEVERSGRLRIPRRQIRTRPSGRLGRRRRPPSRP